MAGAFAKPAMAKKKITCRYQTPQAALARAVARIHVRMTPFRGSSKGCSYRRVTGTRLQSQNVERLRHL
jgi:hypothetical protein